MQNKKVIVIIVLVLLVAVAIGLFLKEKKNKELEEQRIEAQQQTKAVKTNIDFSQTPERFPANVPIEEGARLTQNYNATKDRKFQATRGFETIKSLDENLALYTEFLKNDGWEVKATINDLAYKMVVGYKGDRRMLQVEINENKANSIKTVTITYTE